MFDIHQFCTNKQGEWDEDKCQHFITGLVEEFAAAPEGQALLGAETWPGWAEMFLEFYFNYIEPEFPLISEEDVRDILFGLFPRKVSTEPESAPEIVAELHAFWTFLGRQYGLSQAPAILGLLNDDAISRLKSELANPGNFGMAKSLVMSGQEAGFDMSKQDEVEKFIGLYNASLPAFSESSGPGKKAARKKKKAQRQARKRNRH